MEEDAQSKNDYFEMRIPWKTLGNLVYNRNFI